MKNAGFLLLTEEEAVCLRLLTVISSQSCTSHQQHADNIRK
jgi:hypothetical protein